MTSWLQQRWYSLQITILCLNATNTVDLFRAKRLHAKRTMFTGSPPFFNGSSVEQCCAGHQTCVHDGVLHTRPGENWQLLFHCENFVPCLSIGAFVQWEEPASNNAGFSKVICGRPLEFACRSWVSSTCLASKHPEGAHQRLSVLRPDDALHKAGWRLVVPHFRPVNRLGLFCTAKRSAGRSSQ